MNSLSLPVLMVLALGCGATAQEERNNTPRQSTVVDSATAGRVALEHYEKMNRPASDTAIFFYPGPFVVSEYERTDSGHRVKFTPTEVIAGGPWVVMVNLDGQAGRIEISQ